MAELGLLCFMGFSLVATSGGYPLLQDLGFSLQWLLLLQSVNSVVVVPRLQSTGSIAVVHEFSCSVASGISPDRRLNLGVLRWQVDSLPQSHQGSPSVFFKKRKKKSNFSIPHDPRFCQELDIINSEAL